MPHCHPNGWISDLAPVFWPRWRHHPVTPAVTTMQEGADLRCGDVAHGVVEAHPEHAHEEVNGVAGQVALRPAPIGVFEEETGMSGQFKVARLSFDEWEAAPL